MLLRDGPAARRTVGVVRLPRRVQVLLALLPLVWSSVCAAVVAAVVLCAAGAAGVTLTVVACGACAVVLTVFQVGLAGDRGWRDNTFGLGGERERRARDLAAAAGVELREVLVLEKVGAMNAMWTPRPRLPGRRPSGTLSVSADVCTDPVVFDAAVAHELGHAHQRVVSAAVAWSLARTLTPVVVPLTVGWWGPLVAAVLAWPIGMGVLWWSRCGELAADRFAVSLVGSDGLLAGVPDSQPVLGGWFDTHPPVTVRARALGLPAPAALAATSS